MEICNSGKCGCDTRIVSQTVQKMPCKCTDVCVTPLCGDPSVLSIMAPLIYDEIGINLCATFDLCTDISCAYPTATKANIQVISITNDCNPTDVSINNIVGRPNCYEVTLSNLKVSFAMNLFDANCNLVGTIYPTAVYLPSKCKAPTYNKDTNPSSVTMEIFAPYGPSYDISCATPVPIINYIGSLTGNNTLRQGINLIAYPKLIGFDTVCDQATVGLTLVLQSLYFAGYNIASEGKIQTPKGDIMGPDNSDCMEFVAGELLNLDIKPLQLGPPHCEECLKKDCREKSVSCGTCPDCHKPPKPKCCCQSEGPSDAILPSPVLTTPKN